MGEIAVDNGLLRQVDHNVRVAIQNIKVVGSQVVVLQGNLAKAQERIKQLRAYVEDMRREQRNAASLQRALTEIVRIRQELEQKFGKYQEVRDAMLGILQANDHALVTTSTISKISEELMIATPGYWLAPCVIALAAWISNDQALAKRAVEEALSRDPEKTSMLMALICRRAAAVSKNDTKGDVAALQKTRYEASQNWLTLYFQCQDPNNISRSVLLFVNAYANGVFGDDDNENVDGFIQNKWLKSLSDNNPNFEKEQIETWDNLFANTMASKGTPATKKYPTLAKFLDKQDFANLAAYADRVDISENFLEGYFVGINRQEADTEHLVKIIDEFLRSLVTDYDDAERGLREEEKEYQLIKKYNGDIDIAKAAIKQEKDADAYRHAPVSLIQYLHQAVAGNNENDGVVHDVSEKKTALKFTKPFIQKSYDKFIGEKKDKFPTEVKATVEGLTQTVKTKADAAPFTNKVKAHLEKEKEEKKAAVKPTMAIVLAALCAVLGIIFFACSVVFLGIVALVGAALVVVLGLNKVKNTKLAIDEEYNRRAKTAAANIELIVKEWTAVSTNVANFNSKPKFDVGSTKTNA